MLTLAHGRRPTPRIAVGLAILIAAGALRTGAAGPAAAPPDGVLLQTWLRSLQSRTDVGDQERQAIQARLEEARTTGYGYPLTAGLRVLYPDLTKALALLLDEKPGPALELLRPLQAHADPFLAATATYLAARAQIQQENDEAAVTLLNGLLAAPEPRCEQLAEACFFAGLCHLHMLQRDQALAAFTRFLKQFPQAPARDRATAEKITALLQRFEEESLDEATDLMKFSRRRLRLDDPGRDTQVRQERIVTILDKIIAKIEEQQQSGGSGQNGGSGQQPSTSPGAPQGSRPGGAGANESRLSPGTAPMGALGRASRGQAGEDWGHLPAKEREEALSHIAAEVPGHYRDLVEQYYKSLQQEE